MFSGNCWQKLLNINIAIHFVNTNYPYLENIIADSFSPITSYIRKYFSTKCTFRYAIFDYDDKIIIAPKYPFDSFSVFILSCSKYL